jgi:hypothetical protein
MMEVICGVPCCSRAATRGVLPAAAVVTFLALAALLLLFIVLPNVRKAREAAFREAN